MVVKNRCILRGLFIFLGVMLSMTLGKSQVWADEMENIKLDKVFSDGEYEIYAGNNQRVRKVLYHNGKYIMVGDNGYIGITEDFEEVKRIETPKMARLNDVIWDGEKFIAVGHGCTVLESEDGEKWIDTTDYKGDFYNENRHFFYVKEIDKEIIIGANGLFYSIYSGAFKYRDGGKLRELISTNSRIESMILGDKKVVIFADTSRYEDKYTIYTYNKVEGLIEKKIEGVDLFDISMKGMEYLDGKYVMATAKESYVSRDLKKWDRISGFRDQGMNFIVHDGEFLAYPTFGLFYTSKDGVNWKEHPTLRAASGSISAIQACEDEVILFEQRKMFKLNEDYKWDKLSVVDGSIWSAEYGSCFYHEGKIFYFKNDRYFSSEDGLDWKEYKGESDFKNTTDNFFYVNGEFMNIVQSSYDPRIEKNSIFTSKDGIEWRKRGVLPQDIIPFEDVIFMNGMYMGITGKMDIYGRGGSMRVYTSSDLKSWDEDKRFRGEETVHWKSDGENLVFSRGKKIFVYNPKKDEIKEAQMDKKLSLGMVTWDGEKFCVGVTFTGSIMRNYAMMTSSDLEGWTYVDKDEPYKFPEFGYDSFNSEGMISIPNIGNDRVGKVISTDKGAVVFDEYSRIYFVKKTGEAKTVGAKKMEIIQEDIKDERASVKWEKNMKMTKERITSVAFGDGKYLTVGSGGIVNISKDGERWKKVQSNVLNDMNYVEHIGDVFLAVGDEGFMATSEDGMNWDVQEKLVDRDLYRVSKINDEIFIGGSVGTLLMSKDGKEWTEVAMNTTKDIFNVMHRNGEYVILAGDYFEDSEIVKSRDLKKFERIELAGRYINDIAYGDGKYINIGFHSRINVSEDGDSWNISDYKERHTFPDGDNFGAVEFGGGRFVIGGDFKAGQDTVILYSSDGKSWNHGKTGVYTSINDIKWDGKKFIAVGEGSVILTSNDGHSWAKAWDSRGRSYITDMIEKDGVICAFSEGIDADRVIISEDGEKWRVVSSKWNNNYGFKDVRIVDGVIRAKNYDAMRTSKDGIKWTSRWVDDTEFVETFKIGDKSLALRAENYDSLKVFYKSGKASWKEIMADYSDKTVDLYIQDGKFYLVKQKHIYTSEDGRGWAEIIDSDNVRIYDYHHEKDMDIITTEEGIITMIKGEDDKEFFTDEAVENLVVKDDIYLAFGRNSAYVSLDGITWNSYLFNDDNNFMAGVIKDGKIILAGGGNVVYVGEIE